MKFLNKDIFINSKDRIQFFDLTEKVENFINSNSLKNGHLIIFSNHTTLAIRVNEKETGIFKDAENFFSKLLPHDKYYAHNDFDIRTENLICDKECVNGDSHLRHLLLGTSEALIVEEGKLKLGIWQRVLAIELDGPRKNRKISLNFMGE